ncbi:conserved hypothetical protein [Neospora caninum Liverpool]|uniref:Prenylcysteine lyase domain-containing protein n=1 Tax=Neospora caninum (strain Liverpool) TaxID=572307 RepID=F0VQT6_NEOCL|nr:conserved hypothetical protein [Neospora caninum Liverpool]CBZ56083.1 conserved hypothetical protein [Neospora caninum Liverpool]CEL70832.1 TPA: hypothetical protein BN1204_065090 [Neospora caninum Liverpool]|eukprot:XP_003886109.1 conserved hypothetical protein [Neospora caninum Liverpool]
MGLLEMSRVVGLLVLFCLLGLEAVEKKLHNVSAENPPEGNVGAEQARNGGDPTTVVRVAIVGGGITGAATSAFLKVLEQRILSEFRGKGLWKPGTEDGPAKPFKIEIDVFESNNRLGGRLDYAVVNGQAVDIGGSDIEESNIWLSTFHNMLNRHISEQQKAASDGLDGSGGAERPVPLGAFESSDSRTLLIMHGNRVLDVSHPGIFLALRGNGTGLLNFMRKLREKWRSVYSKLAGMPLCVYVTRDLLLQPNFEKENGHKYEELCVTPKGFASGLDMLDSAGLKPLVQETFASRVASIGLTAEGMDFVSGVTRAIYSQDSVDINSVAGAVAMLGGIGTLFQEKRYSGRVLVEYLINRFASNTFLDCAVSQVVEAKDPPAKRVTKSGKQYTLSPRRESCDTDARKRMDSVRYDFVVVAAPLELSGVKVYRRREEVSRESASTGALEPIPVLPKSWRTVHLAYLVADAIRWTRSPYAVEDRNKSTGVSRLVLKAQPKGTVASNTPDFYVAGCWGHAVEHGDLNARRKKMSANKIGMSIDIPEREMHSAAQESGDESPGKQTWCRVASPQRLTEETLRSTFVNPQHIFRHVWMGAYPLIVPFDIESTSVAADAFTSASSSAQAFIRDVPPSKHTSGDGTGRPRSVPAQSNFVLTDNVLYPSAFESIFSCMEGQAVSAQNTVNLIGSALDILPGDVDTP